MWLDPANPQLNKNGELHHLLSLEGLPADVLRQILDTAESFVGVISLLARGQDNSTPARADLTLDPGQAVRYTDILQTLFGFSGAAALVHRAGSRGLIIAASRTYAQTGSGTYGSYVPAVARDNAIGFGPGRPADRALARPVARGRLSHQRRPGQRERVTPSRSRPTSTSPTGRCSAPPATTSSRSSSARATGRSSSSPAERVEDGYVVVRMAPVLWGPDAGCRRPEFLAYASVDRQPHRRPRLRPGHPDRAAGWECRRVLVRDLRHQPRLYLGRLRGPRQRLGHLYPGRGSRDRHCAQCSQRRGLRARIHV